LSPLIKITRIGSHFLEGYQYGNCELLHVVVGGALGDAHLGCKIVLQIGLVIAFSSSVLLALIHWNEVTVPASAAQPMSALLLFVYAAGCGLSQTAVPSLVGDQFYQNPNGLSTFYNLFYAILQLGGVSSRILFPMVHRHYSWCLAIAIFMAAAPAAALTVFLLNRNTMVSRRPLPSTNVPTAFAIILRRMFCCAKTFELEDKYDRNTVRDALLTASVLRLHLPLPFFWALYFQMFALWQLQAKSLNLTIFVDTRIQVEQSTALNPLFDVVLLFGFTLLFRHLQKSCAIDVTPTWKMFFGYFCAVAAFAHATVIQFYVTHMEANSISVWLQTPQYILVCAAAVLVYPAALHQAYLYSPPKYLVVLYWHR